MEGAREGGEKREFWGKVIVESGSSVLDEVPGLERVKFSQEGVTVSLESG